ncbi:MAG TPA: response regulator [Anaerolineales bacterium]|nr:response regulator [Anaerolineales bacterium]HNA90448.1 response regulator [Anaerolineales bacterium]
MATILIVEDTPDNAELARKILAAQGYQVIEASNAETGYQLALDQRPDLLLLDLGLPDHDGLTLAGWLRAEPSLDDMVIIAFTAWPPENVQQMAESYGCNGFISKPIVSVNDFVAQIDTYLKK